MPTGRLQRVAGHLRTPETGRPRSRPSSPPRRLRPKERLDPRRFGTAALRKGTNRVPSRSLLSPPEGGAGALGTAKQFLRTLRDPDSSKRAAAPIVRPAVLPSKSDAPSTTRQRSFKGKEQCRFCDDISSPASESASAAAGTRRHSRIQAIGLHLLLADLVSCPCSATTRRFDCQKSIYWASRRVLMSPASMSKVYQTNTIIVTRNYVLW